MFDESNRAAVLVTGATGFIGRRLVEALRESNAAIYALMRHVPQARRVPWPKDAVIERHGDFERPQTLDGVCTGVETVFHLAGYGGPELDGAAVNAHWRVTVEGTRNLLAEAAKAGVRRFVFVSSVKVMGEGGSDCLDETSLPAPVSFYGRAKHAAERLVLDAGTSTDLHACVVRLPLVYGLDNEGNIPRMIASVDHGFFPPLPEIGNKRSMVHVDDAVQALLLAATSPQARGQVYIATDGEEYSARRLYSAICRALGRPVPRWALPELVWWVGARIGDALGRVIGRALPLNSEVVGKLIGSACYSAHKIARELGYRPTLRLEDALPGMVAVYRRRTERGAVV